MVASKNNGRTTMSHEAALAGAAEDAVPTAPALLDLLRERRALFDRIAAGTNLHPAIVRTGVTALAGAAIFGVSLGAYAGSVGQVLAGLLKLPLLLLGTTLLTFPAFYVLQSWQAPRPLDWRRALALQSAMLGAIGLMWGALAPPVLFLIASIGHYRLAQLLAVVVGAVGGLVGLGVLRAGYRRLCTDESKEGVTARGRFLLAYFAVFGLVGSQLGWMLRPFIGSSSLPFQLFRTPAPGDPVSIFAYLLTWFTGG